MPRTKPILALVTHVSKFYGPSYPFVDYLSRHQYDYIYISHPFAKNDNLKSECKIHTGGILEEEMSANTGLGGFSYVVQFLFNLLFILRSRKRIDLLVGMDLVNALAGIILMKIGLVKDVAYYVIDYTPLRFSSKLLNFIYHLLDTFCARKSSLTWNISERISAIRQRQGVKPGSNLVVPMGVELSLIPPSVEKRNKNLLVYIGHISTWQRYTGLKLMIEALDSVKQIIPSVKLIIIGAGDYVNDLDNLVDEMKLREYVEFRGYMSPSSYLQLLPSYGIGVAIYYDDPNDTYYYTDPTKPKEYLACGLPMLISNVPWISKLVHEKGWGVVVKCDVKSIVEGCLKLLTDVDFYDRVCKNIRGHSINLDWDLIFSDALSQSFEVLNKKH